MTVIKVLFFSKYKSNETLLWLELFAWSASGRRMRRYGLAVLFLSPAVLQSDSEAHAFSHPVSLTPQRANVFALVRGVSGK